MLALELGERRAVSEQVRVETGVDGAPQRAQDDVETLRGRVAPEREQPQLAALVAVPAAVELPQVDPVPDRADARVGERHRAAVDAEDRVRDARGGLQRRARVPVRVPEQHAHAERARERRGEHGVDRAHVREHAERARVRELGGELALEAQAPPDLRARAEDAHAAVRGQRSGDRPGREDGHVVDALGERRDLRDRRGERGVRGVDGLRDEDERAH